MADGGLAARREAALRLPPLADGRRDPVLEPKRKRCHICGHQGDGLVLIYSRFMCRDRVECYQRDRYGR